ncbi:hypothetical protein L596_014454 [Steinernema carpocapsae]|uniref:EGF-like domain-containing protein n=1 Tax=Steinernema carpocapsae TaxID=34508 RepID=A0A4U5NCT2_STECR|nr:hypothetical protein L596_014454 [Steinernema carpocapsae]
MSLRPILILLALSLAATVTLATEMRSDVDSSAFKWFSAANFFTRGSPFRYFSRKFARIEIGTACSEDEECLAILNSTCIEGQCRCEVDFYAVKNTCVQTPGFKEACADSTSKTCRFPFQCIHGICDCPLGFKEQDGKCQKDCKAGSVLIEKENQCYAVKELGLECAYNEQCSTRYSECADGQCRCIPGTVRKGKQCISLNQCPLGETPLENGSPLVCDRDTLKCPNGTYCLYAQFSDKRGFCCPEIKMNCPVGTPLNDKDCSNCPWETHHCFSYTISSVQQQMCCPNDCPRSQPIRHENHCYAPAAHESACSVHAQCTSIAGSFCADDTKTCECPVGSFHEGAKCKRISKLGDECESSKDCALGSNTECVSGICQCIHGFIPEPMTFQDNQLVQEHCIAKPFCPTISGLKIMTDDYIECDSHNSQCPDGKFCRKWWTDGLRSKSYSLCCPTPKIQQYRAICDHFGMEMVLANGLEAGGSIPIRCPLAPVFQIQKDAYGADSVDESVMVCPSQSICIFNPFSSNEGICCHYRHN